MPFEIPFFNSQSKNPNRLPHDTDFQQQRLAYWQKTPTPRWVMIAFSMIALIFVPIGIAMITSVNQVHQTYVRYDDKCAIGDRQCQVSLTIDSDMKTPVYVYYQLHNYYQNHRRYVSSYSPYQLHGDDDPDTTECGPTDSDNYWLYQKFGETRAVQYPCGAVAGSFFNDTFSATLQRAGSTPIQLGTPTSDPWDPTWVKGGIVYNRDRLERFIVNENTRQLAEQDDPQRTGISGQSPGPDFNVTLPRVDDEDFIVWMRNSALDTFRKLYRIIRCVPTSPGECDDRLRAGDVITFTIDNQFDTNPYHGQKKLVVSTVTWAGGKNYFLGAAWVTVGGVCLILAALFALITILKPPQQIGGDVTQNIFQVPGGGQLYLPQQRK